MASSIPIRVAPWFHKQLLLGTNPVRYFKELAREFGDFVHVRGVFDFYFLNSPELVGFMLNNKEGAVDRVNGMNPIYERLRNVGRSGLATSGDEHWKKQRRTLAPLFTPAMIRGFGETMIATGYQRVARWEALSRAGTVLDLKDEMNDLSLEVNVKCLFNADVASERDELQAWFNVMKEYVEAFPYPLIGDWWFPTPLNFRTKRALRGFDAYAKGLIERRRQLTVDETSRDLIGRMLFARDAETGQTMSDEEVSHEMLTFLIAGYESTASAFLWTFYHLSQNPAVEAKLHAELDAVLGDRPLTVDALPKLAYTRRVIDEVMRITPSVWFMARSTTTDVELGGNRVPKGAHLAMSIASLHNNPEVWPDPERFDPDRFLPEASAKRSPNAYVPFGRGPHACIGAHFSVQELMVATAVLGSRFRVVMEPQDLDVGDVRAGMSVYPRSSLKVRVVPRERAPRVQ